MRALLPVLLLLAAASVGARADKRAPPTPAQVFQARCSTCHDPSRVFHRTASRDEWREIVDRMRRMPQSGISPKDAAVILDYLVSLDGRAPAKAGDVLGGRDAWGPEWISVLGTAPLEKDRVRLGGVEYEAEREGLTVTLRHLKTHVVSLTPEGLPGKTSPLDSWKIVKTTYEVHLIPYEIANDRVRVGLALTKNEGRS